MDSIFRLLKTEIINCPICYKKYKITNKYQHYKTQHHILTEKAVNEYKFKVICINNDNYTEKTDKELNNDIEKLFNQN